MPSQTAVSSLTLNWVKSDNLLLCCFHYTTQPDKYFAISEVAADLHELMIAEVHNADIHCPL